MNTYQPAKRAEVAGKQLVRYALVGVASNTAGYLVYLLITYLGIPPKTAMSLLYAVAATASFFGNRSITFAYKGGVLGSSIRYFITHVVGYSMNLAILVIFVDLLGYPHQFVQAIAIFVVAAFLFVAFKFFVFRTTKAGAIGENA
jgi:putative flippase GtrA